MPSSNLRRLFNLATARALRVTIVGRPEGTLYGQVRACSHDSFAHRRSCLCGTQDPGADERTLPGQGRACIKFTDAGEVSIVAAARNGHFAVSVTDTGPGIPLDQQDRIFDQFHQVDSSLIKAKGGTALGLAIAKQIVEMHGGRIWVVSTPGKGSTFQIELPTCAEFRKLVP